jgi:sigma54-dependent transcription regulator
MDPFMAGDVAGEEQPGPILSIMSARQFESLLLFYTPHTRENALAIRDEVRRRHPDCEISAFELPVSDPQDYSSLMGSLARQIRELKGSSTGTALKNASENYVCVSSGTAEMRAAWFLLAAEVIYRLSCCKLARQRGRCLAPRVSRKCNSTWAIGRYYAS